MPLCLQCGKANASESLFCEACGTRLGTGNAQPVTVENQAVVAPATAAKPMCGHCGTLNEPGMSFCRLCGGRLGTSEVGTARSDPAATTRFDPAATTRLEPVAPQHGPRQGHSHARSHAGHGSHAGQGSHPGQGPSARTTPPSRGRVVVLREGRDAEAHPITSETFDVGRSEGQLLFGGDPHLAPRHLRFLVATSGAARVRPLDTVNGAYLRVAGGCDLVPGDVILVGRQILRYETVGAEERDPPTVAEHGVRLLGSAVREAWGRLRQLTSAGTSRDVWHLTGAEVCIGRRGEVTCDDPDVADRHALVRRGSGRPRLEDEGAPGGTFVRLRGERELKGGEVLRLGEQTVRFEAAGQAGA